MHYKPRNFFTHANAVLARLTSRHVETHINIGNDNTTWISAQRKRYDIGRSTVPEMLAIQRCHSPTAHEGHGEHGVVDLERAQHPHTQRGEPRQRDRRTHAVGLHRDGMRRTSRRYCLHTNIGGGSAADRVLVICSDNVAHETMPNHVGIREIMKTDSFNVVQDTLDVHQARIFTFR